MPVLWGGEAQLLTLDVIVRISVFAFASCQYLLFIHRALAAPAVAASWTSKRSSEPP